MTAHVDELRRPVGARVLEAAGAWAMALVRGVVIGAALGAAYRGWMRLISTEPTFSWSGTILILLLGVIAGVGASLARTARLRFRRRWARGVARVLGTIFVLALGMGQGMVALPVWLLGGLAWARPDWYRWVRAALLLVAGAAAVGMFVLVAPELAELSPVRRFLAVPSFLALAGGIAFILTWPIRQQDQPELVPPASATAFTGRGWVPPRP